MVLKVWEKTGADSTCVQQISHPAVIWGVASNSLERIATACADGVGEAASVLHLLWGFLSISEISVPFIVTS